MKEPLVLEQVGDFDGGVCGARDAGAEATATLQPVHTRDRARVTRHTQRAAQSSLHAHLQRHMTTAGGGTRDDVYRI